MDKTATKRSITFLILFLFALTSGAQEFDHNGKDGSNPKWLQRWIEFETQRLNPGGEPASPDIFLSEATRVAAQKASSGFRSTNPTWIPVGLSEKPTIYTSSLNGGMGRINTIAFHPGDSNTFFVGVAQGGVWKTNDGGQSWNPITDDLPIIRISDIAIDVIDPDIMYISVGDYAYLGAGLDLDDRKRHTHYGLGVYKTTDGGLSWAPTGLTFDQTQRNESLIRRVLIDPKDHNHLIAGGITGIYSSDDAGASWSVINDSLIWDMIRDPQSDRTIYAASGYVKTMDEGNAGILKSTDFGMTWTTLNSGIPLQNVVQRIKLAVSPQDSNYVYALTCNMDRGFYGLYRSTNGGTTWTQRSTSPNILHWSESGSGNNGQGTYDLALMVDPNDKDLIYSGGINMWGSTDGGLTWDGVSFYRDFYGPSLHADIHYYAFNPLNQTYYVCHDGGLSITKQVNIDGWAAGSWTTQWTDLMDMQITSFYRMGINEFFPGYFIGGSQDNSTYYKDLNAWSNIIGGDGMDCLIYPANPNKIIGSAQFGYLYLSDDKGQNISYISSQPRNAENAAWTTPFLLDPLNSSRLVAGYGNVWETTNEGASWTQLSNFPNMSLGYPAPIVALDIAGSSIYAGSRMLFTQGELSKMWVSTNSGSSWSNVTSGLPDSLFFTSLDAVGTSGQIAYVTVGGFQSGKKVYKTTDAGANWQNISYDLPNIPANVIKYQEGSSHGTIFVGTDVGVFMSNDTMTGWVPYGQDLPNVIVSDLEIDHGQEILYAATFGRGIWEVGITSIGTGLLDQGNSSLGLTIFPNPGNGDLNFSLDLEKAQEATIRVIDIMGRERLRLDMEVDGTGFIQTGLNSGKYFLLVETPQKRYAKSFLVL